MEIGSSRNLISINSEIISSNRYGMDTDVNGKNTGWKWTAKLSSLGRPSSTTTIFQLLLFLLQAVQCGF
jgi:hypothetical protein